MLSAGAWQRNQQNLITFVLVNSSGVEVTGLGGTFTLQLSKAGSAFVASSGVKAEIGNGWYSYLSTDSEADTLGPISLQVTHASIIAQNLEYVVERRTANAVEFTYTVTDQTSAQPIYAVQVWMTTDVAGANIVWAGYTDAFGIARDSNGEKPLLDPGTYYIFRKKIGYSFTNPDIELVS